MGSLSGVFCPGWSLSGDLCPGGLSMGSLSKDFCPGGSLSGVSVLISVHGGVSLQRGLYPGWSVYRVSVQEGLLSGCLCSGGLCLQQSVWGSLSWGSLSRVGSLSRRVSIGGTLSRGLCPEVYGGLCPGGSLSWGYCQGSLSKESLSGGSMSKGSVQGSLSRVGISVKGSVHGVSVQ